MLPSSCDFPARIVAIETTFPGEPVATSDLLEGCRKFLSDDLARTISTMQVRQRHSIVRDLIPFLRGERQRSLSHSTAYLAAKAVRKCLDLSGIEGREIDAFIAVTNTPDRPLPGAAYEIVHLLNGRIRPDIRVLNLSHAGCSALLKGIDLAKALVESGAARTALVTAAESHMAFVDPLDHETHYSYREVLRQRLPERELRKSHRVIGATLFGDGAVAVVVTRSEDKGIAFGTFSHLTNLDRDDPEILRINRGGARQPDTQGTPLYEMTSTVPRRGAAYMRRALQELMPAEAGPGFDTQAVSEMSGFLIHTGSRKILEGVCRTIGVAPDDPRAASSFHVLRNHANVSSVSVGIMLEREMRAGFRGKALALSFGVGFSATSGVLAA